MKMRSVTFLIALAAFSLLTQCGDRSASPPDTAATERGVDNPSPPEPPASIGSEEVAAAVDATSAVADGETTSADIFNAPPPPPADLGGFGSDDPATREDRPDRGVIIFDESAHLRNGMAHWEQFDWTSFTAKRPGRYAVELTYTLQRATLPVQFKLGEQRLKKTLASAAVSRAVELGQVYLPAAGDYPFSMYAPTTAEIAGIEVLQMTFVPAPETPGALEQSTDGRLTFPARTATTWSETMRYEPDPKKDCLGFWTDPDDFAEWSFTVLKPTRYEVIITQGCGEGQGGSRVAVRVGGSGIEFNVKDTGGFQNWEDVSAGVIEVREAGLKHLTIDPIDKVGTAVMDVQKIVLKPVS